MDCSKQHGARATVKEEMCWTVTNRPPIGTILIDIHEGYEESPENRSRLVAQQIKPNAKDENAFAATPPLEARKLLFSMAMTEGIGRAAGKKEEGMT